MRMLGLGQVVIRSNLAVLLKTLGLARICGYENISTKPASRQSYATGGYTGGVFRDKPDLRMGNTTA